MPAAGHAHRKPMRPDHEACRPPLRSEEEPRARCLASGGTCAPFTLATTPRLPGEWHGLAGYERADGICTWMRAAGRGHNTAQARSRASVVPRPTPIRLSVL